MQRENLKKSSFVQAILHWGTDRFGRSSPLRLLGIIITSIFFAEVIAMIVVRIIEPLSYTITTLIDAGIMTILIFPIIYLFSFYPLLQHIEKLQRTEKTLQQKEELNERFFDSIDTLIAYMDCDFNFIRVNDAYAREGGQPPEYFAGKNYFDLYPHAKTLESFRSVVTGTRAYSAYEQPFEFPSQPGRGITYWNWSLQPVLGTDGTVEGLVLSQVNVTERKRAEQKVELERARLRSILDTMPDGIYIVNQQYNVEYVNPVIEREFGPVKHQKCYAYLHDQTDVCSWCKNPMVFQGKSAHWEWTSSKTGKIFEAYDTPLRNTDGSLSKLKVIHDITERKRSEEQVLLFSSIVEQTADTVVVTDCDGAIEYVNPAFENLTGYSKMEATGQTPRVIKSGIHDSPFYTKMWNTILNGQAFHGEITNRKKNGDVFHEVKTITPLRNQSGEITHFVATGKDITERKLSEEQLRKAFDELEIRVQDRTEELRIANSELEDEINVRRRAEAALQQSEQRLKRAQEISHLGSWELDLPTNQLNWSDEVYRIFGLEPQEFGATYEAFLEAVHPEDRDAVNEAYSSSIREGRDTYEIEHRVVKHSTGEVRIVHEKCEHFRNERGNIIRSIGMVQDITERKQAEEALRVSEEKFRTAFADASIGFAMTTPEGRFVEANPAYCRIIGCELNELLTMEFQSLIHPEDYASNLLLIDRMLAGEITDFVVENRYLRNDGQTVWVRKSISLVRTLAGDPKWIIALVEDITERKHAEEALRLAHEKLEQRVEERTVELAAANQELSNEIAERREIERQLRIQTAAMEAAANGIIITDPNGIILWTNPAMTQISGYTYSELVGQSTHLFNSGRQDRYFYSQMWETILAGNVWQGETVNRRRDGGYYVEEQTITPVRDEHGKVSHFIAVKQDITERKLIYSQLEDSNRELTTLTTAERQQRLLAEGLVESSVALNMSLELHAVLDRIIEQTRRAIPYRMADVVLIDESMATVVRQWDGETLSNPGTIFENDNLSLHDFPTWEQICSTRSAIIISDTTIEGQWAAYFGMTWVRSYLGAPLIYNDHVIGIINLISDQAGTFHEGMAKTLQAFAAPAAVAIQNARLYENEQQNRKLAETLSAASVALAQTLDIQIVLETILDYAQFAMQFDAAFVILSEGEERYRIRAIRTGDQDTSLQTILLDRTIDMLSQPIIRSYLTKHASTSIPDSRAIPGWDPPVELAAFRCWLGIPLESMGKVLGIVVVAHTLPHSFEKQQIQLMEAVVQQAVVALQNAWLFEQVRSGRERLQQLSRHLVEIQENERKYIARELHDETSQSLTSLKLGLQVIEQKAAGHEQLTEQVLNLKKLADETLESLHHLAVNLRPASLDHLGLVDALTGLVETTRQRSGLNAHLKTMGSMRVAPLTEEMETSIYRIVQESITNVVRHAQATYVDVILEWQADKIVIIIEDDGVGIDMERAREKGHLGLVGMQERAEMLDGKLLVDSTPQVGTTLLVEIPYAN